MSSLPEVKIEGQILTWARTSINLPIDAASKSLHMTASELEDFEQNGGTFAFSKVEEFAAVYRRPSAVFFLKKGPASPPLPDDHRTLPRREAFPLTSPTLLAIRFAQRLQRNIADLSTLENSAIITDLPTATMKSDPAQLAKTIRKTLGVTMEEQAGWKNAYQALSRWRSVVEGKGVFVLRQKMPIQESRAFSLPGVPPVIVLNANDWPNARTFSLFHELCHLVLRGDGICDMRVSGGEPRKERVEIYCNHFAAALLVPPDQLARQISRHTTGERWSDNELAQIARFFSVSREVILRSLLTIGETTDSFYQAWREADEQRLEFQAEQKPSGIGQHPVERAAQEHGERFVHKVLQARGDGVISAREAADYLDVGVKHLDRIQELSL